jgi:hypothetical protein
MESLTVAVEVTRISIRDPEAKPEEITLRPPGLADQVQGLVALQDRSQVTSLEASLIFSDGSDPAKLYRRLKQSIVVRGLGPLSYHVRVDGYLHAIKRNPRYEETRHVPRLALRRFGRKVLPVLDLRLDVQALEQLNVHTLEDVQALRAEALCPFVKFYALDMQRLTEAYKAVQQSHSEQSLQETIRSIHQLYATGKDILNRSPLHEQVMSQLNGRPVL